MPIIPPPPASGQLGFGHDAYLNGTATQLTSSDNEVIQGLIFLQSKAAEPGLSSGLPNLALHVILLAHKKPLDVMASGSFRQMSQAGPTPVEPAIQALEAERQELLRTSEEPYVAQVRQLLRLRGIGPQSAWLFVTDFFAWREFRNRRQVGALAGLAPTPYRSGDEDRELGIS